MQMERTTTFLKIGTAYTFIKDEKERKGRNEMMRGLFPEPCYSVIDKGDYIYATSKVFNDSDPRNEDIGILWLEVENGKTVEIRFTVQINKKVG